MNQTVLVGLIGSVAALLGALIGTIPSILQYRLQHKEQKLARIHAQTIELLKTYGEHVKLLEISKGVYSTHEPPLFLYWIFFRSLRDIDEGETDLSPEIKKLIARDIKSRGRDPKEYGLDADC